MAKIGDIEEVFLQVLQEDNNKGEISSKIDNFTQNDWQTLVTLSIRSGLFPTFYTRLLNLNLRNIPSEFLFKLKKLYLQNLKRNIILEKELRCILSVFKESNIPVIPLKGPILARYLYGDLSLRQTSVDLDLLVHQENIKDAYIILKNFDYNPDKKITDAIHKFNNHEIRFYSTATSPKISLVDLHWDICYKSISTHIKTLWKDVREIDLDGYSILVPSNEDLFLYLTLLSIFDYNSIQIRYLYDLHKLIVIFGKEINWEVLIGKARQFNLKTALYFSLKLSQELFDTDLPKGILATLRPPFIKEKVCELWINRTNILKINRKVFWTYVLYYLINNYLCSDNIFDGTRMCYKKIFVSMEEAMWICNQPLSKVSYSLYIKRLLDPFITSLKNGIN